MKLSEELRQIKGYYYDCGYLENALKRCSERAEKLEKVAWEAWYREALGWGVSEDKAKENADIRLERI